MDSDCKKMKDRQKLNDRAFLHSGNGISEVVRVRIAILKIRCHSFPAKKHSLWVSSNLNHKADY